jgi:DNA-binding NarL/FixJ family response regulator
MASSTAIQDSLANIELEIERLTKAREALLELVDEDGDEAVEETAPKTKSRSRRSSARSRATADDDEGTEEKAPRRSRRLDKRAADRKASRDNGETKAGKPTKKDRIIALLDDGMSPREIADELDIATNYVYNVKRGM